MRAQDVMSDPAVTIRPDMSVRVAATMLALRGLTSAPVVTEAGDLVGVVTEADLAGARASTDHQVLDDDGPRVGSVVTAAPTCLEPGAGLTAVATHMLETGSRSVLIVRDGRLLGVVTAQDVLKAVAGRQESALRFRDQRLESVRPARW